MYEFQGDQKNVSIYHQFMVFNSKNIPEKLKELAQTAVDYFKEITGYDQVFTTLYKMSQKRKGNE